MPKQYLDKDGLQTVINNIKEAKEIASGAIALAQAAMEKISSDDSFTNLVYERVQDAYRYTNNGYFAFVSNTVNSVVFDKQTYNCYNKISEALSTEYPNLPSGKILCVVVLEGTYKDIVITDAPTNMTDVIITGIDKNKCIVYNDESVGTGYDYAPFKIMSGNSVMNLTIHCVTSTGATRAYCIHSDTAILPLPVLIKNCILDEQQARAACIGFGTGSNSALKIENCVMNCISGSRCLYGHNSIGTAVNEDLYIINCSGKSEDSESIYIFDANHYWSTTPTGGSEDWKVHFRDNYFINNLGEAPTELSSGNKGETVDKVNYYSGHIRRMLDCSGNNSSYLNYDKNAIGCMTNCLDLDNAIPEDMATRASFMAIYVSEDIKPLNAPTNNQTHWFVDAYRYTDQEVVQIAYSTHQDGAYIRRKLTGTWTTWKPMINA